jgi:hypothetical protein
LTLPVGDEREVAVVEAVQRQLAAGRGLHPAHDQAVLVPAAEGLVADLGHLDAALQSIRDV